jgi:type IV pilus assembly protein PilV
MVAAKTNRPTPVFPAGTTLIEVLVTVAVTSIGLLGMTALIAVTAKVNQDTYLRTQADFAAQTLIESMHINVPAIAGGGYDGVYPGTPASGTDCAKLGCSPQQRADYDRLRFDRALSANLPNAKASLKCAGGNQPVMRSAAYDGVCRLEVGWSERALNPGAENGYRSLVWIFQP